MTKLLEKNKAFEWIEDCQTSFEELKKRLTLALGLILPDLTKKFDIYNNSYQVSIEMAPFEALYG
jgi:hypothetical protein